MLTISLTIACSRYTYDGVILHAHPVRGESYNQRNTTGEVATLPPDGWRPGPGKVGQDGQKSSTYDVTHKKNTTPKQKFFFECRLEDLPRLLRLLPGL